MVASIFYEGHGHLDQYQSGQSSSRYVHKQFKVNQSINKQVNARQHEISLV